MKVANINPMGQTRQKTGNPKTADDRSAPPRIKWRESIAGADLCVRPIFIRPFCSVAAESIVGVDLCVRPFSVRPEIQSRKIGAGQIQAQKKRPNIAMIMTAHASGTSIRKWNVRPASAVSSAPSGQIEEIAP